MPFTFLPLSSLRVNSLYPRTNPETAPPHPTLSLKGRGTAENKIEKIKKTPKGKIPQAFYINQTRV
jgi:hypothetical protein